MLCLFALSAMGYWSAGKLREGRQLCCQAGQAWRCLSLAGGGEWGPLPVGAAAEEAAEHIDQQVCCLIKCRRKGNWQQFHAYIFSNRSLLQRLSVAMVSYFLNRECEAL